mmetsp:Transcript_27578/g.67077  ORF Transcript_27578/g.67077 Transcript_27578/m.67077 type:complete len:206 (+) Transcript_27578:80-697(+)
MAFEQQLEADRIDDFNLFSAFVRVPLLILEGVLGQQQQQQQEGEEEQSKCERSTLPKHSSETRPQDHTVSSPLRVVSNDNMSSSSAVRGGNANAKKQLGWMDKSNSYSSLSRTRSGHTSLADIVGSPRLKKNRQTSWSDESGLSLVEYLGEVSFVFHLVFVLEVSLFAIKASVWILLPEMRYFVLVDCQVQRPRWLGILVCTEGL